MALAFIVTEWCSRQVLLFGTYETKVSILALCKILEHGIQTNNPRLVSINVKGEWVINANEGIQTTSKTSANSGQWREIPVFVEIYKLMIHELSNCLDHATTHKEEDDYEDEEWEKEGDKEGDAQDNNMQSFAPALHYAGFDPYGDDDGDHPDAIADPISHMEVQSCLLQFLVGLSRQPIYSKFSERHTHQELQVLQSAGVLA
ncbi:hypothetical protein MRX96_007713 [Rhipicephalus microplus]|uniref:Uncharacterized protein n=1 Tax=Rhipicephalus microplus TaxID=6941 RepID=A0A9J6E6J0_RHIMP|nr:hypothetical protein HPB51_005933 [Rhipicephalus microplus]